MAGPIGERTGRIFLFGNRSAQSGDDAVVQVLDPDNGLPLISRTVRQADGRNWFIYEGAVSADETQLFVSYHGPERAGPRVQGTFGRLLWLKYMVPHGRLRGVGMALFAILLGARVNRNQDFVQAPRSSALIKMNLDTKPASRDQPCLYKYTNNSVQTKLVCPRQDLNLCHRLRRPVLYPG
jgi:hypothetical protein